MKRLCGGDVVVSQWLGSHVLKGASGRCEEVANIWRKPPQLVVTEVLLDGLTNELLLGSSGPLGQGTQGGSGLVGQAKIHGHSRMVPLSVPHV